MKIKISPTAAAVPLLLLLLTWLSIRATDRDAEMYDRAIVTLDHLATVGNALHRDVLNARAGVLRNYDPLVREVTAQQEAIARLREAGAVSAEAATTIDQLAAEIGRQEDLIEQFKTDNALLQNSLAYFGRFSAYLGAPNRNGPLVPAVSALGAAMLQLTLDTSPEVARQVDDRLNDLARQAVPPGDAEVVQGLMAHARMLRDELPATDAVLKILCTSRGKQLREALRGMIQTRQAASRASARGFRLALYGTSLLLLGLLVHLGLQLRARALTLRRHAEFEHAIARISTRFINSRPQEIGAHVKQALAELGACAGADRAYFMAAGDTVRVYAWCREAVTCPPGWPDQAPALAARLDRIEDDIVCVHDASLLPPGAERDALAAAGVRSWACIARTGGSGHGNFLGFDSGRASRGTQDDEFGLLRMALDAIANAVGRQDLERERARLEAHLQQARRMETVGALASGIAHNFNNIVGAILGYAEMASEQVGVDRRSAGILEEIRRAGERARSLVEQILVFGRRQDARSKPMSVQSLIAETVSLLRASLPAAVEIAVRQTVELAIVSGEAAQLQQVILNLCKNAAQAVDLSGRIEIEVELHGLPHALALSHGTLPPGRYVRIAVSDTGRGMSKAVLERLFEPFFTTRMAGNGLGLATTREIVREHGGALNVRSAPGSGSCFEVWLPRIDTAPAAASAANPSVAVGDGKTVLVIENERERLLRDEEALAALGYEPVGFTRAADALAACRAAPERFDAMLVGHLMPSTAAVELAAVLHQAAPRLPILLATASSKEIGPDALISAGISEVLHWPLGFAELAAALARCLVAPQRPRAVTPVTPFSAADIRQ